MKKLKIFFKKIMLSFLCLTICFTFLFDPMVVNASAPIYPALSPTDAQFGVLESLGYIISCCLGVDVQTDDGNPYTEHDMALFAYDYLTSHGFSNQALDTFYTVWYMDKDWNKPKSYDELNWGTVCDINRQALETYKKDGTIPEFYVEYNENSRTIFDTLGDFITSIKDGTNTVQLGGKPITLSDIKVGTLTGFDKDLKVGTDGKFHHRIKVVSYRSSYSGYVESSYFGYAATSNLNALYVTEVLPAFHTTCYRLGGLWKPQSYGTVQYMDHISLEEAVTGTDRTFASKDDVTTDDPGSTFSVSSFNMGASYLYGTVHTTMPIFGSYADAKNYLETGVIANCLNFPDDTKIDRASITNDIISKAFLPLIGTALSLKGLRDAYINSKDKVNSDPVADVPAYVNVIVNIVKDIPTIDDTKDDPPIIPGADAGILEWLKTIATTVLTIPSELRRISLTALESSVGSIADTFPAIKQNLEAITDVFPAIRQDVKAIGDAFPAVKKNIQAISDDFPAVRKQLETIGDIFPSITGSLDTIVDIFPGLIDFQSAVLPKIKDIADNVSLTGSLAGVLPGILTGIDAKVDSFPAAFTDSLKDVLNIPLTDIVDKAGTIAGTVTGINDFLLSLPDYTDFLREIIKLLQQILSKIKLVSDFFVLDTKALTDAFSDALADVQYNTGLEPLLDFYKKIKFSDDYEYPKIKMDMPSYTKEYFNQSEIVLIDTADYTKQFLYVRTLLKFCLWFTFGLAQFKQIKVLLHIA